MLSELTYQEDINLNILKKGIDSKIQAILKYLEGQLQNPPTTLFKVQSNRDKKNISTQYDSDPQIELQTTKYNIREEKKQSDKSRKFPLNNLLNRQKLAEDKENDSSLTPVKICSYNKGNTDSQNSNQSFSKLNIQENSYLKIFGAPLQESNSNLGYQLGEFSLKIGRNSKKTFGDRTSRSKYEIKSKQIDYQEQEDEEVNQIACSRQKTRQGTKRSPLNRTPNRTNHHSNQHSTGRKLYDYFSWADRNVQPINIEVLSLMKGQIQQLSRKIRKQAQDNNVRVKLLKRILSNRNKTNQVLGSK